MDPQRWTKIESLYHAALAKSPGERGAYLDAFAEEPEVRREVESLLLGASEPVAIGKSIGPYEILGLLGAGGMGEVYRARDSRLKRDVALKVLPEAFANNPERMARFQREAEVLASINHPNIAHVYGLEDRAIVMELVEGGTLSCPFAVDAVLDYAHQIAEALEYAHERGIVHRDLKPANIKVTAEGVVKLLDFGLAKAIEDPGVSSDPSISPTITIGSTRAGMILGTAAYMSPEQAAGKPADRRADIWSFGAVLYEMLAGKRAFDGESISETLAGVLKVEPDWSALPAATPPAIRTIVRRCLTKDRKQRLQAIGEARIALENPTAALTAPPTAPSKSRLPVIVLSVAVAITTIIAALLAFIHFGEKPPAAEVVRFEIPAPGKSGATMYPIVSPNGRLIAFCSPYSQSGVHSMIWVRSLDSTNARQLPGTDNFGGTPIWSPDSRFLAFVQGQKLKKVDVSGGVPQTLCDLPGGWRGGAWSRNNVIIFGAVGHGILRVSDSGGLTSPVTALDPSWDEGFHALPSFLPDSRHFIYYRDARKMKNRGAYVGSLDAKPEDQKSIHLPKTSTPLYVPSTDPDTGCVLFQQEGGLFAQRFDNRRLQLSGDPVFIAGDLVDLYGPLQFSASDTGALAYFAGGSEITQLAWLDRAGRRLQDVAEPGHYSSVTLSPDGSRAAVSQTRTPAGSDFDIWVHDFAHHTRERLTSDPSNHYMPVWSPEGSRIAYTIRRGGVSDLCQKPSSGSGDEEVLLESGEPQYLYDWSRNGRFLLYGRAPGQRFEVWYLPIAADDRNPKLYLETSVGQPKAQFSPDGRFIAYTSDDTGREEIYVRPFPDASSAKWLISTNGGTQPRWRRDGKELFYISSDSKMMAAAVTTTPEFKRFGLPRELFTAPVPSGGRAVNGFRYDVSRDGEKFLINTVATDAASARPLITVVLNWQTLLLKK